MTRPIFNFSLLSQLPLNLWPGSKVLPTDEGTRCRVARPVSLLPLHLGPSVSLNIIPSVFRTPLPARNSPEFQGLQSRLFRLSFFAAVNRGHVDHWGAQVGMNVSRLQHIVDGQIDDARHLIVSGQCSNLSEAFRRVELNGEWAQEFLQSFGDPRLTDQQFADAVFRWGFLLEHQGSAQEAAVAYQVMAQDPRFSSRARAQLEALPGDAWIRNQVSGFTDPQNILLNAATLGTTAFVGGLAERAAARAVEPYIASQLGRRILGAGVRVSTESLVMPALGNVQHSVTDGTTAHWSLAHYFDQVGSNLTMLGLFRGINVGMGAIGRGLSNIPVAFQPAARAGLGLAHYGANLSGFVLAQGMNDRSVREHPLLARYFMAAVEDARLRLSSGLGNTVTRGRLHRIEQETQESYRRQRRRTESLFGGVSSRIPSLARLATAAAVALEPAAAMANGLHSFTLDPTSYGLGFSVSTLSILGVLGIFRLTQAVRSRPQASRAPQSGASRGPDRVLNVADFHAPIPLVRRRVARASELPPAVRRNRFMARFLGMDVRTRKGVVATSEDVPMNIDFRGSNRLAITVRNEADVQRVVRDARQRALALGLSFHPLPESSGGNGQTTTFQVASPGESSPLVVMVRSGRRVVDSRDRPTVPTVEDTQVDTVVEPTRRMRRR